MGVSGQKAYQIKAASCDAKTEPLLKMKLSRTLLTISQVMHPIRDTTKDRPNSARYLRSLYRFLRHLVEIEIIILYYIRLNGLRHSTSL